MTRRFERPAEASALMHVAIVCPDVDESLRFYRDGLGFSRTYEWTRTYTADDFVVFSGRGVYLEMGGHSYLELFPDGRRGVDSSAGPIQHIAITVPDVDIAYRDCLAAGGEAYVVGEWSGAPTTVTINGDPEMEVRVAFVRGPAGELVELYEQYDPVVTR